MNRKLLLVILASVAAALPELLPKILTPERSMHVLAVVSFVGAIVTGVTQFLDHEPPELPRPTGESGLDMSAIDEDDGA